MIREFESHDLFSCAEAATFPSENRLPILINCLFFSPTRIPPVSVSYPPTGVSRPESGSALLMAGGCAVAKCKTATSAQHAPAAERSTARISSGMKNGSRTEFAYDVVRKITSCRPRFTCRPRSAPCRGKSRDVKIDEKKIVSFRSVQNRFVF